MKPSKAIPESVSYNSFLPNLKPMWSKFWLIKQGFGFITWVFYCRKKLSNSGPGDFGLFKLVGLLTVGLISGEYRYEAIKNITFIM